MIWNINDEKNPKTIKFQLQYFPFENKIVLYGQHKINMLWTNLFQKEYNIKEFNQLEISDILIDNYQILLDKIEEYKNLMDKFEKIKTFNIVYKK